VSGGKCWVTEGYIKLYMLWQNTMLRASTSAGVVAKREFCYGVLAANEQGTSKSK